jgi:rubrerythrin
MTRRARHEKYELLASAGYKQCGACGEGWLRPAPPAPCSTCGATWAEAFGVELGRASLRATLEAGGVPEHLIAEAERRITVERIREQAAHDAALAEAGLVECAECGSEFKGEESDWRCPDCGADALDGAEDGAAL